MGTIAISSTYGADGEAIGRAVAERLGVDFFDRAIPVEVARRLAVDVEEAFERDWHAPGRMERVLDALASASLPFAAPEYLVDRPRNPEAFRMATEAVLKQIADGPGGVILGRASVIVLADRSDVLRVRLDGPVEDRIHAVMSRLGIDEAAARRDERETDSARSAYASTFYGRTLEDVHLYHVALDRTALSRGACIDIVLTAAEDRFRPAGT